MIRALAFLLSLAACAPPQAPLCTTRCGLAYMGTSPDQRQAITCGDVQRAEDVMLRSFAESSYYAAEPDPTMARICASERRAEWWTHEGEPGTWREYGRPVAGLTWCGQRVFATAEWDTWRGGAFPHEIAHLAQNCAASDRRDPNMDVSHYNWIRAGILDGVSRYETYAGDLP